MKSPGIIINNIYKLQEKIYEDGFINTFIAEDIQQNRKVQVKILKKESISHRTEDIIRFHNDITSVIQCDHPHIEKIYEVIEEDTMHFIVGRINRMENLYELFNRGYTFEQADIIDIIMQTAKALKYAHGKGILHSDLNPKNIFLSFH